MIKFILALIILFTSLTGNVEKNMDENKRLQAYQMAQQMDEQQTGARADDKREKLNTFLKTIAMIESSGGQNFNHEQIQSGMHKGHRAAGSYGLMPNTVNEVLNRLRRQGEIPEELDQLRDMSPDVLKETLETNPKLEQQIAEPLGRHVLDRQKGDEEKAAYSWFQGHNLTPEAIESKDYATHDYVDKYRKYRGK